MNRSNSSSWVSGIFWLVILGLAFLLGYWFLHDSSRAFITSLEQLRQIDEINRGLLVQNGFQPPEAEPLQDRDLAIFVAVQQAMADHLGPAKASLEEVSPSILREMGSQPVWQILFFLETLENQLGLLVAAKQRQVQSLNEQGVSLSRYHWIRQQVLLSLEHPAAAFTLEQLAHAVENALFEWSPDEVTMPEDVRLANLSSLEAFPFLLEENWLLVTTFGI